MNFKVFFRNQACTVSVCQAEADPVTILMDLKFLLGIKLHFSFGRVLKIKQILRASFKFLGRDWKTKTC